MEVPDIDWSRVTWLLFGLALTATLGFVAYSFVGTFVFGVFIYYATRPLYDRLKRRIYPKSLAAATAILSLALPALLLFAYTVAIAIQEFENFAATRDLGALEDVLLQYGGVSDIFSDPTSIVNDPSFLATVQSILRDAQSYLGFIGNALLHLFVMLAIAFYLLRDGPRLARFVVRRFGDDRGVLQAYMDAIDRDFQSVFFGNILNAIITGIIGALAYSALNYVSPAGLFIPYPFLLGLLTGVASLVPVVGMKLVYVPVAAYLVVRSAPEFEGAWFILLFVGISFVIVDALPDFVLRPYVSGRNLHIGMVMFAYIFGPILFGWYGIFLGPMILVLVVHFTRLVLPELMDGQPIQPYAVDPAVAIAAESSRDAPPPPDVDPESPTSGEDD